MLADDLLRQDMRNKKYVDGFCETYKVKLLETDVTFENGFSERMYFFSDNLGGYTIKGIKKSLAK